MTHIPFITSGSYPVRIGNRIRPLIDGEPAFREVCAAIEHAQSSVWVAVTFLWPDFQMPDGRGSFFEVLSRARQRGVDIRVLFWRPDQSTAQLRTNAFWGSDAHFEVLRQQASGISIRWDRAHPGFCQHQKCWLLDPGLDSAVGFVGSINLNPHSVVAPGHRGAGQNHDLCLEVRGPLVTDIQHNFVQRWNEASERDEPDGRWGPEGDQPLPWPDRLAVARGSAVGQLQRTIHPGRYTDPHPTPEGTPFEIARGEYSNRDQYAAGIRAAREYVYLEHQAISVQEVLAELVAAIKRGVTVVLVVPTGATLAEMSVSAGDMFGAERQALAQAPHFVLAGLAGREPGGVRHPVHLHSKLMIVDDCWATVGSCNLHLYSLQGNSELNVAFAEPEVVRALRTDLLREHIDQDTSTLDGRAALQQFGAVARRNARRREAEDHQWEGLAWAVDPLQWWPP